MPLLKYNTVNQFLYFVNVATNGDKPPVITALNSSFGWVFNVNVFDKQESAYLAVVSTMCFTSDNSHMVLGGTYNFNGNQKAGLAKADATTGVFDHLQYF
jgi:hypothetical protein